MLVGVRALRGCPRRRVSPVRVRSADALLTAFGAALVPVLFAYGGWQTASFVAGELRSPRRDLPRGLLIGVAGVVMLYLLVNFVCIRVAGDGRTGAARPRRRPT